MKPTTTRLTRLAAALLIVIACALRAQPAPAPAPSQITAVTVYTDRAIVTRSARVDLPAGDSTITLEKFPAALLDASVQVRGRGTAAATILDVTTAVTHTDKIDPATQPRARELSDQIKELDKARRALNDRDALLQQQIALVEKIENAIAAPPGKDSASQPKLEDMPKLLAFSQENRARLTTERQELADQSADTNAKRDALQKQLNEILSGGAAAKSHKTVTVRVTAARAGSLDLTVDYTIPGAASWTPAYDARLRADTGEVELAYNGIVRQTTGEDWKNVTLTLSTARPGLGGGAPKNKAWFVDMRTPARDRAAKALRDREEVVQLSSFKVTEEADEGYMANTTMSGSRIKTALKDTAASISPFTQEFLQDIGATSVQDVIDYAAATVNKAMTSASFKTTVPATIPSDNTPQKVFITTTKLATKLQYEATPVLQETAYLIAYLTNTTDFPLLAGGVNVFLDDAFVATSQLKTVMPSEKFQLALGADEGVSIKRRLVNRFAENKGITGSRQRVTYEYLTTVTNNKKTPARVVFTEALPISKNEKISVNLLAPAPRDVGAPDKPGREVTREEDNILWWRLDLKPGEKRELPCKFNVEYPGDAQVIGVE